jgi:hypothetical protein
LYAQANACFYLLLGEKEIWLSFAFFGVIFEKYFFFSSLACILQKIQNRALFVFIMPLANACFYLLLGEKRNMALFFLTIIRMIFLKLLTSLFK